MSGNESRMHQGGGSTPVPDPTILTTAALTREIASLTALVTARMDGFDRAHQDLISSISTQVEHLKELHQSKIDGERDQLRSRLDGMDKATELLQSLAVELGKRTEEKIDALRNIHEEKFASIQVQFRERDVRAEQTQKESKSGLETALIAAKEAVAEQNRSSALSIAKSETATMKQIDQLGVQIATSSSSANDKIADVKDRLNRIEGNATGSEKTRSVETAQHQWGISTVISVLAILISCAVLVFNAMHK